VDGHRVPEQTPTRTVGEFAFDLVVGAVITLVVLVGLRLIVPRIPRK